MVVWFSLNNISHILFVTDKRDKHDKKFNLIFTFIYRKVVGMDFFKYEKILSIAFKFHLQNTDNVSVHLQSLTCIYIRIKIT